MLPDAMRVSISGDVPVPMIATQDEEPVIRKELAPTGFMLICEYDGVIRQCDSGISSRQVTLLHVFGSQTPVCGVFVVQVDVHAIV